jgi:hypothetical protein
MDWKARITFLWHVMREVREVIHNDRAAPEQRQAARDAAVLNHTLLTILQRSVRD